MRLSVIVAVSENGIIGKDNELPWRLSADLRRFKRLTMGHHLIMGRRTFESIGRPLPGRHTIVLSRDPDLRIPQVQIAADLDGALHLARNDDEVFVAGGAQIYALSLPRAQRLYLTRVHASFEGDAMFPAFDAGKWNLLEEERHEASADERLAYSFLLYERDAAQ